MPLLLFARGQLEPELDPHAIAIVGSRRPTPYGRRQARRFAAELAARGVTIVSGLARGIDGEAHAAALDAGAEGRLRTLRQLLDLRMELMLSQLPPGSAELASAGRACGMWSGAADGYGHQGGGREKVDVLLRAVDLSHYAAAIVANGYVSSEDLSDADDNELSELAQRLCMKRL